MAAISDRATDPRIPYRESTSAALILAMISVVEIPGVYATER